MRRIAQTERNAKTWPAGVTEGFTSTGKQQLKLLSRKDDLSFTEVKGEPRLFVSEQPSMKHWPVIVNTDRGSWMVTMTQQGSDWRVEAISKWDR